ncbi:hypothetical protein MMYC01_202304 [Madurella mycetomatis]|uniref:Uncharacterized protein n=1 Tax=Madurella mycetomatis TaxID=100816 RepID=A0A175WAG7_9PEZI|nr:hypothetical protein MMYC01_202304 [Madurella mycetomatis]
MEQSFGKAEMRGPGGGHPATHGGGSAGPSHHYSTLEVVPAPDYDKEAIRQPGSGYDKEVVQQPNIPAPIDQKHYVLQTPISPGGPVWGGNVGAASEGRILGLKRRTFFIIAWVVSIVVAIAVGLGAGLGATMGSRSTGTSATTAGAVTDSLPTTAVVPTRSPTSTQHTSPTSTQTPPSESTTTTGFSQDNPSPPHSSTDRSSPSPPPQSTTSIKIGGVGGRCSNEWGGDCICLDEGICRNKWKGTPYTGFPGNWPCPDDPENIMACIVQPCLGKVEPAQCLWREACRELDPGKIHELLTAAPNFPSRCSNY